MLSWSVSFLVIALVAAYFGWGGLATTAAGAAKVLFYLFVIAFVVSLVTSFMGRSPPKSPL